MYDYYYSELWQHGTQFLVRDLCRLTINGQSKCKSQNMKLDLSMASAMWPYAKQSAIFFFFLLFIAFCRTEQIYGAKVALSLRGMPTTR